MLMATAVLLGNWPRVFAALRALVAVLLAGIGIMLAGILLYQLWLDTKNRRQALLRRSVRETVGHMMAGSTPRQLSKDDNACLFSMVGLAEMLRLTDDMSAEGCETLGRFLRQQGYEDFLRAQLDGDDPEQLALVVRMVARMGLGDFAGRVKQLLYTFPDDAPLQYEAFMALSSLGCGEALTEVCMDKQFAQKLSFRSLQQILGAFTGDTAILYAHLLHAPDPYVARTCIKLIGTAHVTALAHEVEDQLQKSPDDNLLIDSIRCLGQLGSAGAAPRITAYAAHPRWEVRAIVATALGETDAAASADVLAEMLCDGEWQVRYNAGLALQKAGLLAQVAPQVEATGDSFAMDMLRYMSQTGAMWRAEP